jgi:hypothetical protein
MPERSKIEKRVLCVEYIHKYILIYTPVLNSRGIYTIPNTQF